MNLFPDPLMSDGRERDPEASRSQHATVSFTLPGVLGRAQESVEWNATVTSGEAWAEEMDPMERIREVAADGWR